MGYSILLESVVVLRMKLMKRMVNGTVRMLSCASDSQEMGTLGIGKRTTKRVTGLLLPNCSRKTHD